MDISIDSIRASDIALRCKHIYVQIGHKMVGWIQDCVWDVNTEETRHVFTISKTALNTISFFCDKYFQKSASMQIIRFSTSVLHNICYFC